MRYAALVCALSLAAATTACIDEQASPTGIEVMPSFLLSDGIVTELGFLPGGTYSRANAVNATGAAAGMSVVQLQPSGQYAEHAAFFSGGTVTDLGRLGGARSEAFGINDAGVVVGSTGHDEGYGIGNHAFSWSGGTMSDLNLEDGDFSVAFDINNAGDIVGDADTEWRGWPEAIMWEGGVTPRFLGALCDGCASSARAISENGYVVGWSNTGSNRVGFLLIGSTMTALPPLPGYPNAEARGVNSLGNVVGFSGGPTGNRRATLWRDGQVIDLGEHFPSEHSEARGINDQGQIVGEAFSSFAVPGRPVIWQSGTWGFLPYLTSGGAYAINNSSVTSGVRTYASSAHGAVLWNAAPAIPAAPEGVSVYATSHNEIQVVWTDASWNETRFTVMRRSYSGGVYGAWTLVANPVSNMSEYGDASLSALSTYQYRVRSCNAQGCSAYVNSSNATTLDLPTEPPYRPTVVEAVALSGSSIGVNWSDASNNEDTFEVERRMYAGTAWGPWAAAATLPANHDSYLQNGLNESTSYQFRVRACNSAGCSQFTNALKATTFAVRPTAPTNLTATPFSATRIDLSWVDASTNETSFLLQRRTRTGGVFGDWVTVASPAANATSHSDTGLTSRTMYQYRLRACSAICSTYVFGAKVSTP